MIYVEFKTQLLSVAPRIHTLIIPLGAPMSKALNQRLSIYTCSIFPDYTRMMKLEIENLQFRLVLAVFLEC
jgi:hypothetical protein